MNLKVTPVNGEPTCFLVTSENNQNTQYKVDILCHRIGNHWNGECGCDNFHFARMKLVRAGTISRCKHLDAARDFALDNDLTNYARENNQGSKAERQT